MTKFLTNPTIFSAIAMGTQFEYDFLPPFLLWILALPTLDALSPASIYTQWNTSLSARPGANQDFLPAIFSPASAAAETFFNSGSPRFRMWWHTQVPWFPALEF